MKLPTVSVIVPTCDRPELLAEALDSVLEQQFQVTELLVVDDGPAHLGEAVLGRFRDREGLTIRVLQGPRRGPAAARNAGIRHARGELIAFLDDDDLWLPDKLACQVGWFMKLPRLVVLGTGSLRTGNPARCSRRTRRRPRQLRLVSHAALLRGNRIAMSSVLVRRRCFEECGCFDESLPLAQDWELWLRIAARWDVGVLPPPLTIHRLHEGQRSADRAAMRLWEAEVLRRHIGAGRIQNRWLEGVARRRMAWAHCRLARLLMREGEVPGALQELRKALALFPCHPLVWSALARCALARREPARASLR